MWAGHTSGVGELPCLQGVSPSPSSCPMGTAAGCPYSHCSLGGSRQGAAPREGGYSQGGAGPGLEGSAWDRAGRGRGGSQRHRAPVALPSVGGLQTWPQPVVQHLAAPGQSPSVSQSSRQGPREPRSTTGHAPGLAAARRDPGDKGDHCCAGILLPPASLLAQPPSPSCPRLTLILPPSCPHPAPHPPSQSPMLPSAAHLTPTPV